MKKLPASSDPLFGPLRRKLNREAMVYWINRDLVNRADCDVRKSIVLYDAEGSFVMALRTSITPEIWQARLSDMPKTVAAIAKASGTEFWSVGVK